MVTSRERCLALTISGFCATARIISPSPVQSRTCQIATTTITRSFRYRQETTVRRKRLADQKDDACQGPWQSLWIPCEADDFAQRLRQAKRHHQGGAGFVPVEAPQEWQARTERRRAQRPMAPVAALSRNCRSSVRPNSQRTRRAYRACLRKIDDAHDPEDQSQPTPRKNSSAACDSGFRLCVMKKANRLNPLAASC
jgi:hypothetical protein